MNENEVFRLAILAAQLNPELCKTKPGEAIREARRFLAAVRKECQPVEFRLAQEGGEKWANTPVAYGRAVMEITGENKKKNPHLSYAKSRFVKFWAFRNGITVAGAKQQLREYENGKKSFVQTDVWHLPDEYELWKSRPKKSKGKQGIAHESNQDLVAHVCNQDNGPCLGPKGYPTVTWGSDSSPKKLF